MHRLLDAMARIERMERGTISQMAGRPHHNHQTWRDGRNIVRYVPADRLDALREAIAGYRRFMNLAQDYADEVIGQTHAEAKSASRQRHRPKPRP